MIATWVLAAYDPGEMLRITIVGMALMLWVVVAGVFAVFDFIKHLREP